MGKGKREYPKHTEHKVLFTVGLAETLICIASAAAPSKVVALCFQNIEIHNLTFHAKLTFPFHNIYVSGSLYGGPDFMWEESHSGELLGMCAQREQRSFVILVEFSGEFN